MANDVFGREIPPATGVTPDWRAMIEDFSASVYSPIPVADTTARTTLVNNITASGFTISATHPVFVLRADAPVHRQLEYTVDGTTWRSVAATSGPTAYTPVLTSTSGSPSLGTGGSAGATGTYSVVGGQLSGQFDMTWGTTGINGGAGALLISLPVTPNVAILAAGVLGTVWYYDTSASQTYIGVALPQPGNVNVARVRLHGVTGDWASGSPVAIGASDAVRGNWAYPI